MGQQVTKINELGNSAYKLGILFNYRFPRKVHAVRIPACGVFQRKEDFEIRNELIRLCKNGTNSSRVKTLILHGPAGHGKMYSAANLMDQLYSKPLRSRYFWNKPWNFRNRPTILWTINAKNEATMLESYCSLAKEIGLTEEAKVANQELSLLSRTSEGRQYHINLQNQCQENAYDEALKQIYEEVMIKLKHQGSWVLLIQGPKEDGSSHQQFWPQTGDPSFGNGLVIMTTESQKLRPTEEGDDYPLAKVSINKMTNEDAVRFFAKSSGIRLTGVDLKNAEFIAVKLANCIPQDIAKVAAFVREYKEETNKQLAFPVLPVPEEKTLAGYMMILELTRQNQTQLLKFLACCSSENYLPLEILKRGIEGAVEAVKDSKFVDESTRDEIKVVNIHPRDHATLRDILSRQQSNNAEQTWKYFLKLPFLKNEQRNINIPPLSCLDVSQVIACLSKVCKDALQRNRDKDFVLLRLILPHLKEAVQLSNKMKLEGEFEPHVMAIGHACLGEGLLIFGESEEARGNLETALDRFQNCMDEENVHLDVANVKHFLGEAFSNSHLGDPRTGISHLEEALEEKERFYNGKEDPQIALTLRSLGNVLNELGEHSKAIFHIERALKIYDSENFKQEYGFTISALGSSYRYLGQYSKAEDNLKKALKIFESVESPSELRIGVTLSRLSSVQRNMDKLDESIESLEKARKKFEHNHIYSAVILSKMSVVYRYKGDLKKSVKFAEEAKTISDGKHGTKSHPAIATALLNLGHAQSDVGDIDDAVRNITKALDIYEALHGRNHRIVAATLNYLGYAYQQMGMVQVGKNELERAVEIMEHSPFHPEKANSLKRLSKACLILGETVRSADLAHRALEIYRETYGNTMQHREVRKCAVRVAYACSKLGLFEEAAEYLREVELGFPEEKRSLPEFAAFLRKKTEITLDSFEFNWPLDEAAVQGIFSKANTDLITADETVYNSLGSKHRQFAVTKKERARLNILMGNHKQAYREILSALKIDPRICNYLKADFYLIKSDAEKALKNLIGPQKVSLKTAEKMYRNVFGDDHPMVAFTLQKLCITYLDLAQKRSRCKKEGHEYFEASERTCEALQNNLEQQLLGTQTDFLRNYSVHKHPILKRQQLLAKRIRDDQCAW